MTSRSRIADAFAAVVRDRGDDVLVDAPSERRVCTARGIHASARHLERALAEAGLASGHVVLASAGNHSAMPALLLACLRSTLPLLPVDRSAPAAELLALAARWGAAAIVLPAMVTLPAAAFVARRLPGGLTAWIPRALPEPDALGPACLLKLTSGSTGTPRATCTEERHLVADVEQIVTSMDIGPHTRQLAVIPLSHSYGFSNLLLPLLWQGTPMRLRPQFVPTQVAGDIAEGSLETFAGVPFMFDHLAAYQASALAPTLRLVVSAGARLSFDTVEAFHRATGLKVRSFYGSSETGGICFDDSETLDRAVPVGRPMGGTHVRLLEDEDAPAGSGRVLVEGPAVIDSYAGDPSAARLDGRFQTGDYAYEDAAGRLVLTGRTAAFVNVAGRKVQPGEVEAALCALTGVADAVVLAVDDAVRGQALGACLATHAPWTARQVREALSTQLAPHKLPRVVLVLPGLPVTARGKVDRDAIARLLREAQRG